jgi:hypothetical protein
MVSNDTIFENLTAEQKKKIQDAFGTQKHSCSGCAVYLGKTEIGEHTYFWHYGASDGYVVLPIGREGVNSGYGGYEFAHFDYESGNITLNTPEGNREFTTEGVEILPPPFQYLLHLDLRKYNTHYLEQVKEGFASQEDEDNFLICCGGGSYLPERAALTAGAEPKVGISWVANYWLAPWELTEELTRSALAITMVYPDDRRVIVL